MWINTQVSTERELCPHGSLNHLYGGISSQFPSVSRLALLASESVLGFCQGPPVCAQASLSQDGF